MKTCIVNILVFFITVSLLCSCQREELPQTGDIVPEGYIALSFNFTAPDELQVNTKAADPDGKGINKMTLFCFDNFGMFVSYVNDVSITPNTTNLRNGYSVSGTVNKVLVPENTRRLHFVANQNTTGFIEDNFKGKNERDVISVLEGSSGMIVYWGYFSASGPEITDAVKFQKALEQAHGPNGTPIRMLRNQARIEVPSNDKFTVSGFTVINTNAFGSVAPYHPTKGFNFTTVITNSNGKEGWGECDWTNTDFITLPENTTRLTPPADVDIASETLVFETDNKSSDPVSIIIKGKNAGENAVKYYRVILMDNDGNYVKIRRNFRYIINITGKLNYGQDSFEAALTAPPSNNIWLSIDDEVKEITDNTYSLKVDETTIELLATPVKDETGNITGWELSKPDSYALFDLLEPSGMSSYYELDMGYYVSKVNGSANTAQDAPVVEWADGCEISNQAPINDFILGGNNNYSEATVILDNLSGLETKQSISGTMVITKGLLQRKIKITILKTLHFVPVWVSTQVNESAGENLTLLFTIPDECPDELIPFDVYISAQHVDIRAASGQQLPVITYRSHPAEYGQDTYANNTDKADNKAIGYKYVYTVTQKGDQRVYFTNLLHRTNNDNLTEWITIESPFYETVTKTIVFNNSNEYRIEMPGLSVYVPNGTVPDKTYAYDEEIKYLLVAPKKNAKVDLGLVFKHKNGNNWENIKAGVNDEFFIYSEFLSHLNGHGITNLCNCQFEDFHKDQWGTGGRIHAFKFDNVNNQNYPEDETTKTGYLIHMITDTPYSEEVVRISSNQPGSEQAFKGVNETATYGNEASGEKGRGYRSLIFELSNYHPFHFDAKIGESGKTETEPTGTVVTGNNEEVVDNFQLNYGPEGGIDLYLNIASYIGTGDNTVDPFGTKFYVYIMAPMLELGSLTDDQISKNKLIKIKDGLFAYRVDSTATAELNSPFSVKDANGTNTTRKKLPFAKKSAITKGEITITTDPKVAGTVNNATYNEHIVAYYNKTFKLENKPISGTIKTTEGHMKDGAFVAFSITRNDSRIGSMRVFVEDGVSKYELTLRPEYNFTWTEPVKITHTHTEGGVNEVFEKTISGGLKELQNTPNIVLEKKN